MALTHQGRVDLGIALAAARQPSAVAIRPRHRAVDIAARQHGGESAPSLPTAGDLAASAVAAGLPVLRRVDALQAQLLSQELQRIAVDCLGCSRDAATRAETILQNGASDRQKQKESKGYDEVDGPADPPPAERSVIACPESEARHQDKLNDFQLIMASRSATVAPPDGSLCLRIMPELTAEQVQRGRGPDPTALARRKLINREVRSAREKLTSSTGLQRAFDYELVRVFAQYRLNGSAGTLLLAFLVAAAACVWVPLHTVSGWLALVVLTTGLTTVLCRRFLSEPSAAARVSFWRKLLPAGELLHGLSWALLAGLFVGVDAPGARFFLMTTLLIVSALTVTLAATMPIAVYSGLVPIVGAIILSFSGRSDIDSVTMLLMAACAQLFFIFLTNRLYSASVETIEFRAEKDALIAELETAKANSDEARRKAEEANLAKSRFLATMSHELRTPLNAILGFSEVMKNEVFGPHANASYKEYSGDIHSSGQHLLTLINEILDLSRIEAGKYELNEEAIGLAAIADDAAHMLNLRAKTKGQTIRQATEPELPRIWADERAIRQAVLNILANAIKFTPQGGEISIKVGWTATGGQYVSITDTGPGIPEDEIPVVMQTFGRGSLAIKTAEQGSGLGLPIVKGLIDLHGGGFRIKSSPRAGTEVTITLPAERVMDTLPALPEPSQRSAA
jgi:two-component system, cell cycle sensor histidine kinase PleC